MPLPTPLHPRTAPLNQPHEWRQWSGYLGAGMYEMHHEREYWAIRNSAALIDVSPLFKYEITGPDAARLVQRIITRDITACRIGQILYSPWCDDAGHVIDDGTIARLGESHYRVTAADPSYRWFTDAARGLDVTIRDVSTQLAALALQGPNSRLILEKMTEDGGRGTGEPTITNLQSPISNLKYYTLTQGLYRTHPLTITRTGYTGDLGYELWIAPEHAPALWDELLDKGDGYGILPAGLAALDIARIEAGLVLIEVDYISAPRTFIPQQKSTPFELGLGWAVKFTGGNDFIGRAPLEGGNDPQWALAGLEIDWVSLEHIYGKVGLPPQVTGRANRSSIPIYTGHRQVGYASSHTFSPILKKYIALATLETRYAAPGTELDIEFTVEHKRERGSARVVALPFYNPERKRK
jgi:aminomethyltransferase